MIRDLRRLSIGRLLDNQGDPEEDGVYGVKRGPLSKAAMESLVFFL